MFTKSAFSMAALRLAMAPHAGIATFFGMHRWSTHAHTSS